MLFNEVRVQKTPKVRPYMLSLEKVSIKYLFYYNTNKDPRFVYFFQLQNP